MKLLLASILSLTTLNLFAMTELPTQINCTSTKFPTYKDKSGSTLILKKYHQNNFYHEMSLETLSGLDDVKGWAIAIYRGVDVTYGNELKKFYFNWYAGASTALGKDPFNKAGTIEVLWGNYERSKEITLAVISYVEGSNAQEMTTKLYNYSCNN